MSFTEQMKAWREKALQKASQSTNNIVYDLFTEVVAKSPSPSNPGHFARGLLANQWYSEAGGAYSPVRSSATNDIGIDSISRVSSTLSQAPFLRKDSVVTFTNNTEEAYYAETLGWKPPLWSGDVGPYHMVALSINEILNKYR